jgi:hypothetical protein
MKKILQQTIDEGYTVFKFKVGSDLKADRERLAAVREVLGYDKGYQIMIDANQVWSVPEAIEWMKQLAEFKPVFIEGRICLVATMTNSDIMQSPRVPTTYLGMLQSGRPSNPSELGLLPARWHRTESFSNNSCRQKPQTLLRSMQSA